jgi:hypothetical protein
MRNVLHLYEANLKYIYISIYAHAYAQRDKAIMDANNHHKGLTMHLKNKKSVDGNLSDHAYSRSILFIHIHIRIPTYMHSCTQLLTLIYTEQKLRGGSPQQRGKRPLPCQTCDWAGLFWNVVKHVRNRYIEMCVYVCNALSLSIYMYVCMYVCIYIYI